MAGGNTPLGIALAAAVPLYIAEFQAKGGPNTDDIDGATTFGRVLAGKGDVLLYGGGREGEAADLFDKTARAIAVLAFTPGGITIFDQHFEAGGNDAV